MKIFKFKSSTNSQKTVFIEIIFLFLFYTIRYVFEDVFYRVHYLIIKVYYLNTIALKSSGKRFELDRIIYKYVI